MLGGLPGELLERVVGPSDRWVARMTCAWARRWIRAVPVGADAVVSSVERLAHARACGLVVGWGEVLRWAARHGGKRVVEAALPCVRRERGDDRDGRAAMSAAEAAGHLGIARWLRASGVGWG
jgi:hypothetical protein